MSVAVDGKQKLAKAQNQDAPAKQPKKVVVQIDLETVATAKKGDRDLNSLLTSANRASGADEHDIYDFFVNDGPRETVLEAKKRFIEKDIMSEGVHHSAIYGKIKSMIADVNRNSTAHDQLHRCAELLEVFLDVSLSLAHQLRELRREAERAANKVTTAMDDKDAGVVYLLNPDTNAEAFLAEFARRHGREFVYKLPLAIASEGCDRYFVDAHTKRVDEDDSILAIELAMELADTGV